MICFFHNGFDTDTEDLHHRRNINIDRNHREGFIYNVEWSVL